MADSRAGAALATPTSSLAGQRTGPPNQCCLFVGRATKQCETIGRFLPAHCSIFSAARGSIRGRPFRWTSGRARWENGGRGGGGAGPTRPPGGRRIGPICSSAIDERSGTYLAASGQRLVPRDPFWLARLATGRLVRLVCVYRVERRPAEFAGADCMVATTCETILLGDLADGQWPRVDRQLGRTLDRTGAHLHARVSLAVFVSVSTLADRVARRRHRIDESGFVFEN